MNPQEQNKPKAPLQNQKNDLSKKPAAKDDKFVKPADKNSDSCCDTQKSCGTK